jgi:hypothetical protein
VAKRTTKPKAKPKQKHGRPTRFKPEYIQRAYEMTQRGATDRELAENFGVSEQTINSWKVTKPGFLEALRLGKDAADDRVEASLYRRACGFSHETIKVMQYEGKPVIVPYVENLPPDTTACLAWLNNRRPETWRNKNHVELSGTLATMDDKQLNERIASLMSNPDVMGSIGPKES